MDIKDFQGQSRFKFLIPSVYILSWIGMIFGPEFFAYLYNQYCMLLIIYLFARSLILCFLNIKLVINSNKVLSRVVNSSAKKFFPLGQVSDEIYHAFIIPSYKQDIELLAQTLEILAQHKRASISYLVFMAMEKHQQGSDLKAEQLMKRFQKKFRSIDYTRHEVRQYEQKGKASNVSWCAQHMGEKLQKLMISEESVFLTIMDADSWAPDVYIDEVQDHIRENFDGRHNFIYQPPQIYTRNNLEVPIIVRTYDDMYSSMHASNLISCSGISFSLSNYTMSYSLIKKIGFWDTCEEAIGQDMHMTLKALWKTKGEVKTIPIYAPFNQVNIQTGNGIFADFKAKFWQIERHSRGVADISYCINMLLKHEFNLKTFWTTLVIMETFFLPIIIPWCIIAAIYESQILYRIQGEPTGETISAYSIMFVFNLANIGSFISNLFFQYFKRSTSSVLYGIKNPSFFRILEGSLFYGINLFTITIPAFTIGAFGNLKANRQYVVADKNTSKQGSEQKLQTTVKA